MKNYFKKLALLSILILGVTGCNTGTSSTPVSTPDTSREEPTSVIKPSTPTPTPSTPNVEYFSATYSNPVMVSEGSMEYKNEVADPTVVRGDDGAIYAVGTNGVMLRSEDGCNFEVIKRNVIPHPTWASDLGYSGYGLWAPDLVKVGDKWIYYYSLSGWGSPVGIGLAVADEIDGTYTDLGKLFTGDEIGIRNCIDSQVFIDDDGSVYMSVGSFQGLYVLQLTDDGLGLLGGLETQKNEKVLIAGQATADWDGSQYEGSYIIKENGYYYYFGSTGTCCDGKNSTYSVYVGRSESIFGPYIDADKRPLTLSGGGGRRTYGELVLWAGTDTERDVYGPGHNSLFVDDAGDYWIYYHAYSSADNFLTRHLFMDKLLWDDNGYPYVENKKPSFLEEKDGPRFILE